MKIGALSPVITSEEQMRALVDAWVPWWQARLGLRDWHIDVQLCGSQGIDDEAMAECVPTFPRRFATLRLRVPGPRDDTWEKHDLEETIVHELLHVVFGNAGVGLDDYENGKMSMGVLVEQQINTLAATFVALRRGTL